MKQITNFFIDPSDLKAASSKRNVTIEGDGGSKFTLYISNENPLYYNFITDTFTTTETKIIAEIPANGQYIKEITFPTVTDDDQYDFQLMVNPHYGVELSKDFSPKNSIYYRTSIKQKADTLTTFAVASTTSGDFQTMPDDATSTNPPLSSVEQNISISWTIKALDNVSGGGLELVRQPVDTDFKFTTVPESIGAGSSDTIIYLDSVENLVIGMALTTIESGSVSGSPTISSINKLAKSVTVSIAQTWATEKDITFKGGGSADISSALGANISFSNMFVKLTPLTATVNGATSASNTIVLDSAYGIRADGTVTVSGIKFDNKTTQYVTAISYGAHTIQVTSVQTLQDNTILSFDGCAQEAVINAIVKISKVPKDNLNLTLDLDSILTSSTT